MRTLWLAIALTAFIAPTDAATQSKPSSPNNFVIVQGTVGNTPATILLNTVTGNTWFLGQVDEKGQSWLVVPIGQTGTAEWIPLPFALVTASPQKQSRQPN